MSKALIAALVLSAMLRPHPSEGGRDVPQLIQRESGTLTTPLWVSARVAVRDGKLDLTLFDPASADSLESLRKADLRVRAEKGPTNEPCVVFGGRRAESFAPSNTFDETVDSARVIFAGYIESLEEGFYAGAPGTMLRLRNVRTISGRNDVAPNAAVLLFYPLAAIRTEAGSLCAKPLQDAPPPRRGDAVLLFSSALPVVAPGAYIMAPDANRQVVFGADGSPAFVPNNLRDRIGEQASVAAVERKVTERLSRSGRQR